MPSKERLQGGNLNRAIVRIIETQLSAINLSRRELANRLGTSHTYLNNRLNGDVDFTITDIDLICQELKVELLDVVAVAEWLINGEPPQGLTPQEMTDVARLFETTVKHANLE